MATNLSTPSRNTRQSTLRRRRSLAAVVTGASLMLGSGFAGLIPGVSSGAAASTVVNGRAFLDLIADGYQILTPGVPLTDEIGLAGVTVTVTAPNGAVQSATTNAIGDWRLEVAAAGPYRVEYSNIPAKLSDGRGIGTGMKTQFTNGGEANLAAFGKVNEIGAIVDISNTELTSIGNRIWDDINGNGVQDAGEPGIPNVVVTISSTSGPLVTSLGCNGTNAAGVATTATTNSSGQYEFRCLETGKSFVLSIDKSQLGAGGALAGYAATVAGAGGNIQLDSNGTDNGTAIIGAGTTVPGVDNTYDFGFIKSGGNGTTTTTSSAPTGSIGNFVFLDANNNGTFDAGDSPVNGATVELIQNGNSIRTAITGADGAYNFTGLTAGTYSVRVTRPAGLNVTPTQANVGDDNFDSDGLSVSESVSQTGAINLAAGETNNTVDFGWVAPAALGSIGDIVFLDANGNGIQDAGDSPVEGAKVELVKNNDGIVFSILTGPDGKYLFSGLVVGSYGVRVTRRVGSSVVPTSPNVGDDATDSDGLATGTEGVVESARYNLGAGENILTVDFGWVVPVVTTTTAAPTTTTVAPTTTTVAPTTTTVAATTTTQAPRASFGDTVWFDTNGNNLQDDGEPGVSKALVELLRGGVVVDSMATGADGKYLFAGLAPGAYQVRVTRPVGSTDVSVAPNVGGAANDAIDSDGNPTGVVGQVVSGFYQLDAGENERTVDFGYKAAPVVPPTSTTTTTAATTTTAPPRASIGDTVWFDTNGNNLQDDGEPGIARALVQLLDVTGAIVAATVTDANGKYSFTNLAPGTYLIRVTRPIGSTDVPVAPNSGTNDAVDSDGIPTSAPGQVVTGFIPLVAGDNITSVDFGYKAAPARAAIGDTVFLDVNGNNVQDTGDTPIRGAKVELLDATGAVVASQVTGVDGKYSFTNLAPGTYVVRVTRPVGSTDVPVTPNVGNDATDSDGLGTGATVQSAPVPLVPGQTNNTVDFGFKRGSIGDTVWFDTNGNNVQDVADTPIADATVELRDENGTLVDTKITNAQGKYLFTNLAPGIYSVKVILPPRLSTSVPVTANAGGDDTNDSDGLANGIDGQSVSVKFPLGAGQTNLTVDFGFKAAPTTNSTTTTTTTVAPTRASIGDTVWFDTNGNSVQDVNDTPIVNATVELRDANGILVATTTTDASGKYLFTNVVPGTYRVRVILPSNLSTSVPVTANVGGDDSNDSDGVANGVVGQVVSGPYPLTAGQTNLTVDFGFQAAAVRATIGDTVFLDANGNNIQDAGEAGVNRALVELLNASGAVVDTFVTGVDGKYSFSNVAPGAYQVRVTRPAGSSIVSVTPNVGGNDATDSDGKFVSVSQVITDFFSVRAGDVNNTLDFGWKNVATTDTTTTSTAPPASRAAVGNAVFLDNNGNNIQDAGDTPVVEALVQLLDSAGAVVSETRTDANGNYSFSNLAPGTYSVRVTRPAGSSAVAVTPNFGADRTVDSDGVPTATAGQVVSGSFTLVADQNNTTVDFGYRNVVTAPTTTAAPAATTTTTTTTTTVVVVVPAKASIGDRLFIDANKNGIQDANETGISGAKVTVYRADGTVVREVTTGADGRWIVDTLDAGSYYLVYTLPNGYDWTTSKVGSDDGLDSDVDGSGRTRTITVTSGQRVDSLDAGVVAKNNGKGAFGDRLFIDANGNGRQDPGESGISGATVTVYRADGTKVADVTTGQDGRWIIDTLDPGSYYAVYSLPAGYAFTTRAAAGVDDELNSDADNTGRTQTITLRAGDDNRSLDAGLVAVASSVTLTGKVFTGKTGDTDGPAVPNISVTLTLPDGKTVTTTTDANGKYTFSALAPGDYTVKVALPSGAVIIHAPVTAALTDTAKVGVAKENVKDVNFGYEIPAPKPPKVLPGVEVNPAPAQPGVVPAFAGSEATNRGFQGAGLLLMGLGLAGLLRSRKEQYNN